MYNEIVCVSCILAVNSKRTCRNPTSSFCFSYCIRKEPFKYSRNNNAVFISRLPTKMLYF
ncbi:hypothetical protein FHE73_30195 (plasmid) [Bacillus thuringiensis]|nr:hypothetical protein CGQ22_21775 [Bacillus sp. M13(2017)]PRT22761.1 hypothetical protein C6351_30990 [Bacillus thuringiensis]QCY64930.1 hypothetical protein FHE73_30195 [Bacillus thuringiensis]